MQTFLLDTLIELQKETKQNLKKKTHADFFPPFLPSKGIDS